MNNKLNFEQNFGEIAYYIKKAEEYINYAKYNADNLDVDLTIEFAKLQNSIENLKKGLNDTSYQFQLFYEQANEKLENKEER